MAETSSFNFKRALLFLTALLVFGVLLAPLIAYWAGATLVGEYEGEGGMAGYLFTIWNGIGRGEAGALILVFSPLVAGLAWVASIKWIRRGRIMSD